MQPKRANSIGKLQCTAADSAKNGAGPGARPADYQCLQDHQDWAEAYEVQFEGTNRNPAIYVAPDGTLLSSDFTKPPGVLDKLLIPTGATGTADISKSTVDGRVVYTIEFMDQGKNPTIKVAQDGALVQDLRK